MQEIVDLAAKMRLIVRNQAPDDKRAKISVMTKDGFRLLGIFQQVVESAELSLEAHIGASSMRHLRRASRAYFGFLECNLSDSEAAASG